MNIVGYQPYQEILGAGWEVYKDHACYFLCPCCIGAAGLNPETNDLTPLYDIDVDEDAICDACFEPLRG